MKLPSKKIEMNGSFRVIGRRLTITVLVAGIGALLALMGAIEVTAEDKAPSGDAGTVTKSDNADKTGTKSTADNKSEDTNERPKTAKAVNKKKKKRNAVNRFNRLLKNPMADSNAAPAKDGIHDPSNPGTHSLQSPAEAFRDMPKARDGNLVDWVKALKEKHIEPWIDIDNEETEMFTMDLRIVREVKGSMPNVVFPHLEHTEWLDCTNCHDEIFAPEKGANQISMAAILLGQKCGVCHGKVAFPVTDCRKCHSQPKSKEQLRNMARKGHAGDNNKKVGKN